MLAFHFYASENRAHYYQLYACVYEMETKRLIVNDVMPSLRGGTERKRQCFFLFSLLLHVISVLKGCHCILQYVTGFRKTLHMGFSLKIEFDVHVYVQ